METSVKVSDFIFDCVNLMHYKCHKINLKHGGTHIGSPDWIENKKANINLNNDDNKCFQYGATVALNYEDIEKTQQRMSKIRPFINKYNWKGINYPLGKNGWEKLKKIIQKLSLL